MGQQQLILLVLATVIVGLAIVVGIRAFNENALKANADAMVQDAVRIANDMQAWKQKPAPFGGQAATEPDQTVVNDRGDFSTVDWPLLGYAMGTNGCLATEYGNLNGCFEIDETAGFVVRGANTQHNNIIEVEVCGLSDTEVVGRVVELGGVPTNAPALNCVTNT